MSFNSLTGSAAGHHHLVDDFPVFDGDVALQITPVGGEAEAAGQVAQHLSVENAGGDGNLVVRRRQRLADENEPNVAEDQQSTGLSLVFYEGTLRT